MCLLLVGTTGDLLPYIHYLPVIVDPLCRLRPLAFVEYTMASIGAGLEHSSPFSVTYHLMQQSSQLNTRITPLKVTLTAELLDVLFKEHAVSSKVPLSIPPLEMPGMAQ